MTKNQPKRLATGCPSSANQLDIFELISTGSGGVPPYTFNIFVDNNLMGSIVGTLSQTSKTWLYQILEDPTYVHSYRTEIVDSLGESQSDYCDIYVNFPCPALGLTMDII